MVDAVDSKSTERKLVGVQVPLPVLAEDLRPRTSDDGLRTSDFGLRTSDFGSIPLPVCQRAQRSGSVVCRLSSVVCQRAKRAGREEAPATDLSVHRFCKLADCLLQARFGIFRRRSFEDPSHDRCSHDDTVPDSGGARRVGRSRDANAENQGSV